MSPYANAIEALPPYIVVEIASLGAHARAFQLLPAYPAGIFSCAQAAHVLGGGSRQPLVSADAIATHLRPSQPPCRNRPSLPPSPPSLPLSVVRHHSSPQASSLDVQDDGEPLSCQANSVPGFVDRRLSS